MEVADNHVASGVTAEAKAVLPVRSHRRHKKLRVLRGAQQALRASETSLGNDLRAIAPDDSDHSGLYMMACVEIEDKYRALKLESSLAHGIAV